MLDKTSRNTPQAYRFLNHFLNIAFLTGFVRNVNKDAHTFDLQQTGNTEHMLTINVPKTDRLPANMRPVTVKAHVRAHTREDGAVVATIDAIDITEPNKLAMPTYVAWNGLGGKRSTILPKGSTAIDAFQPYQENGELKGVIAEQLAENRDDDDFSIVQQILQSSRGRLDSKLGENSNVILIAGVVEKAFLVKKTEHTKEYVALFVRQQEDPSRCLPVRLHPDAKVPLTVHMKDIRRGFPVKIVGQLRTKLVMDNDGKPVDKLCYIRCHEMLTPTQGRDILKMPEWWKEMGRQILAARENVAGKIANSLAGNSSPAAQSPIAATQPIQPPQPTAAVVKPGVADIDI